VQILQVKAKNEDKESDGDNNWITVPAKETGKAPSSGVAFSLKNSADKTTSAGSNKTPAATTKQTLIESPSNNIEGSNDNNIVMTESSDAFWE
jgi:hypothetical protein